MHAMTKIALAAALGLIAFTTTASAYDGRQAEIDRRQAIQEQRIQNARRSGELTRREYRQLESEQAYIRQLERNALRDGHIDRREAAQIRDAQNQASRHIYQESHDSERRGFWGRRWW